MNQKLTNTLLCLLTLLCLGCGSDEPKQTSTGLIQQINAGGIITDAQAKSLRYTDDLELNGLTSITDAQAESLSNLWHLNLNGLTSITDKQAESLSNNTSFAELNDLTSITDAQAESLSKVRELYISEDLQPLIDKYNK